MWILVVVLLNGSINYAATTSETKCYQQGGFEQSKPDTVNVYCLDLSKAVNLDIPAKVGSKVF